MAKIDLAAMIQYLIPGTEVVGQGENPHEVVVGTYEEADFDMSAGVPNYSELASGKYTERTLDAAGLLKTQGINLAEHDFELGSPETPLKSNPVPFLDRLMMASTPHTNDRMKILEEKYGKENVKFNPESKSIAVREGKGWHDSDPGFLAQLTADAPALAGGIKGAAVGSAYGPLGTIAGGAIGATVGKLASITEANAVGIRNEDDAESIAKELGSEFMWTAAFGALPYAPKAGGYLVNAAVEKISNVTHNNPIMRKVWSENVLSVLGRYNPSDVAVWLDEPKIVNGYRSRILDWNKQKLARSTAEGVMSAEELAVNPVKRDMGKLVLREIDESKKVMKQEWIDFFAKPEVQQASKSAYIDSKEVADGVLPMISKQLDLAGNAVPTERKILERAQKEITDVIGSGEAASSVLNSRSKVSFEDVQGMRRRIDRIIKINGGYNSGPAEISSEALGSLKKVRTTLRNMETKALSNVDEEVATKYAETAAKYSKRRNFFEDYGDTTLFNPDRIDGTLKKLGGETGEHLREQLSVLFDGTTNRASKIMNRVDAMNAAINTTARSKNDSARLLLGKGMANVGAKTFGKLTRMGKTNEFLAKLPKGAREKLLTEPEAVNNLMQILSQSFQAEEQTRSGLMQQATQGTEPIR